MATGGRLKLWFAVPNGSTMKVGCSGSDENFNVTGILVTQPGGSRTLSHQQLTSGFSLKLATPKDYVLTVVINYLGQQPTEVTCTAAVTRPDGSHIGPPRPPFVSKAAAPATDTMLAVARTLKSGGGAS